MQINTKIPKKSCKTEINFSKNKLSNDMLFICFEFPFYSFNESKSKKALFLIQ